MLLFRIVYDVVIPYNTVYNTVCLECFQIRPLHQGRIPQKLTGITVRKESAPVQNDAAGAKLGGKVQVVSGDEHGMWQPLQNVNQLAPGPGGPEKPWAHPGS